MARALGMLLLLGLAAALAAPARADDRWKIPTEVRRLPNGLTVVISEDHSAPLFGLAVSYRIGFRLEPRGRSGFAHLFEHMMFQGTPRVPKGTFERVINSGGGTLNGFTRPDFTAYISAGPLSALDAVLWLEADRMKGLDLSEATLRNQKDVVKEEIRVNVKNRPYGLFYSSSVAAKAFDRWENAHDGYGSFEDLEAATLTDVRAFFDASYGPGNAVLAIVADLPAAEAFARVEKAFGSVPSRPAPTVPDLSEPLNRAERTAIEEDPLARAPAVAIGWKGPAAETRDQAAAAVLGEILAGGEASRLYQALVKDQQVALEVSGGLNWAAGTPWEYQGPVLFTIFAVHKPGTEGRAVVASVQAEVERIAREGVSPKELRRARAKVLSDLYAMLEMPLFRAASLSVYQLLFGKAGLVNDLPARLGAVTSSDVARVAREFLTVPNRTVVERRPAAAAPR